MPDKEHTRSVSESENPVIPSPTPKTIRPRTNKDWRCHINGEYCPILVKENLAA